MDQSQDLQSGTDANKLTPFLQANNTPIFFDENWDVGIGGGLWSNGLSLSKYFIQNSDLLRRNFEGIIAQKRTRSSGSNKIKAIELGSGNGLLSCCLAAVVGDQLDALYVTDLEDHLELIKQTFVANQHVVTLQETPLGHSDVMVPEENDETNENSVRCHVMECDWGEIASTGPLSQKFDFVFGSDVAYRDYLHEPLISTLLHLSDDHTISIIGVTMTDTKPKFFTSLHKAGFRYERIPDHLMAQEFRGTTFGLFVIQKDSNKC